VSDCLALTSYFGERTRAGGELLADALLTLCGDHGIHSSVLLRGLAGFGRGHQLRSDRLLTLSEDLPAILVAVDSASRIQGLLEALPPLARSGLVTLERTRLLRPDAGAADGKLTVYVGRRARAGGEPAFVAVCRLLHAHGLDGATVLLGVDGTTHGRRVRARFVGHNAEVPVMVVGVGAAERVAGAARELPGQVGDPLVTLERVRVCKRDGRRLDSPHVPPATDERGLPLWQKLVVHTSEAATHRGQPIHAAIVRALRESDAAGVTCMRGVWGFHGAHGPHGDRFLQLRRHAPVMTVTIDSPQRSARSFEIIDELTAEHGLVTSELVPALGPMNPVARPGGLALARPPASA
jgi:PII-like signaling protein